MAITKFVEIEFVDEDVLESWEHFWRPLIEKNEGGSTVIDMYQVMKELHDYRQLMDSASSVYDSCTGGLLSKTNYTADVVIGAIEEHFRKSYEDDQKDECVFITVAETNQGTRMVEGENTPFEGYVVEKVIGSGYIPTELYEAMRLVVPESLD
jgi:hypothetical protein